MKLNNRRIWQISLTVAILVLVIGIATDTSDVKRYAGWMQQLMSGNRYQDALLIGQRSDKTDLKLLSLRIEALGHEHQLGERLFAYPIKDNRPACVRRQSVITGQQDLGSRLTVHGRRMSGCGGDYELCAYLIDKQLDRFVEVLPKYYEVNQLLPRYYREALVLYNHLRSQPSIVYHDSVMDTDYQDLQELEKSYTSWQARQMTVFMQYGDTYWYYFEYVE